MKQILNLLIALALGVAGGLNAGDLARSGTTSGSQLLIPVGARSVALGGGMLGSVSGAEAIYWNPAGIARAQTSELMANNMQYIADIRLNYLGLVYSAHQLGSFGFHLKNLDFGEIKETTEASPDGTGNTFSPTFLVAGLSYSRLLTDRITAGLTGKLIYEGIMQTSASTFAVDLGVQYQLSQNVRFGVVMKNVGGKLRYDGRNLERTFAIPGNNPLSDDAFFRGIPLASDIPSIFSFGASYAAAIDEDNQMIFSAAFSNQNDASDVAFGGIEYNFKDFFFLRGGYNYETQRADEQIFGAAFGAGLKYPVGDFNFVFDYAFRQLTHYFDSNNIFTLKLAF